MTRANVGLTALCGAALVLVMSGCSASSANGGTDDEALSILAAASLAPAFEVIIEDFSAAHPEIAVNPLVTGGSQELVQQVIAGAPADVIALASIASAEPLKPADIATDISIFAANTLVIAVQPGNPHDIRGLEDLASKDLQIAMCAVEVPCGAATQKLLTLNGLEITGATEETSVSAVLAKAELNEVDAAIVYRSDLVTSSADLEAVEPVFASEVVNWYPITYLGENPDAVTFVEYVLSESGTAALEAAGLTVP